MIVSLFPKFKIIELQVEARTPHAMFVVSNPLTKHWHGATPTTAMSHIAVQEKLNGSPVDWMEQVSDEQYRA